MTDEQASPQSGVRSQPGTGEDDYASAYRAALESLVAELQVSTPGGLKPGMWQQRDGESDTEMYVRVFADKRREQSAKLRKGTGEILLDDAAAMLRMLVGKRRRAEGRKPKRSKGAMKTMKRG